MMSTPWLAPLLAFLLRIGLRIAFSIALKIPLIVVTGLSLSSCSVMPFSSVFSHYSAAMQPVRSAQLAGNYQQAIEAVPQVSRIDNRYYLLKAEQARLEFLNQNWQASQKSFSQVLKQISKQNDQPSIELSRSLDNLGAVLTNDSATRYDFPWYAQTMAHSYQALNYVFQHKLESALVEVRAANLVQEQAAQQNEHRLQALKNKLSKYQLDSEELNQYLPSMAQAIGELKQSFHNAFTYYLSGILYEANGQLNDAYIDYKKALELVPSHSYLQQDVVRLALKLAMSDDLADYQQRYPELYQHQQAALTSSSEPTKGQLVIMVEQGVVAPLVQEKVDIPLHGYRYDFRFFSFALPVYPNYLGTIKPVTFSIGNNRYSQANLIQLQSASAKHLEEMMPTYLVRQLMRLIAKEQLRANLAKNSGEIGNVLASIYNIASEQADTRSWSTLPNSIGISRARLLPGNHQLTLSNGQQGHSIKVNIAPNKLTLVNIWLINGHYHAKVTHL